MSRPRSTARRALSWGMLLLLAAAWFQWLRPTTLGGRESYVVVQGHSMDGTYQDGDLVIVREEGEYEVGDIIAFRAGGQFDDPTRIIHRIVGRADAERFITRGDNRDRNDPWQPTDDDIIGRAVLHVPHVGGLAQSAARPQVLGALGGAAVVLGGRTRRRRRRMILRPDPPQGPEPPRTARPPVPSGPPRWLRHTEPRWAFVGLAGCLIALLPLLVVTWAAINAADRTVRVERFGQLDYSVGVDYRFVGAPSPVYPTGVVEIASNPAGALVPAAPLYSRLLDRLEMAITFEAAETGADALASTLAVDVTLSTAGGWSDVVQSVEATPFDGRAARAITVDLVDARNRVAQVTELTGVGGDEFTLTVLPRLAVEGSGGGQSVQKVLEPPVAFVVQGGLITADAVRDVRETAPLAREIDQRAKYGLGPLSLSTQATRGLLGGLLLVALGAGGWFASVLFGGVGLGEPARIAARYRSQVVDVAGATAPPGPVVMVSGIDELARLAKVDQSVILHEDLGDGGHRYRVFLGAVTYEYETAPEHGGRAADAPADSTVERPGS